MCYGCWEEYGKPQIDNEKVREAVEWVREVYEYHSAGGGLHIILDDFNIEDEHIELCDKWIREHGAGPGEEECLALFKTMTMDERASALALEDGYWGGSDD